MSQRQDRQTNRGRGKGVQSTKQNNSTTGGQNQVSTPKLKNQTSVQGVNTSTSQQFESFFGNTNPDQKLDKSKTQKSAKTQIIEHNEFQYQEDDAIISIDPRQEDEIIPQKPAKFFNKGKTINNKEIISKPQNNMDGFTGDAARKEKNYNQKGQGYERELTKASSWVNSNGGGSSNRMRQNLKNTTLGDLEYEDDGVQYDQFADKNTTYSESLYTSQKPDFNTLSNRQIQQAERVAREIENKDARGNIHLAEERGQIQQRDNYYDDKNEELMYSGVHRSDTNKNYSSQQHKKNNKQHSQNRKKATNTPQLKNKKTFSAHQKENVQDNFLSILDEKVGTIFQQRREGKIESTSLFNADNWKDFEHGHPSPDQMQSPYDDQQSKGYKNNNNVKRRGSGFQQRGGHNQHVNNQGNYYNNRDNYQQRNGSNNYQPSHKDRQQVPQQQYGQKAAYVPTSKPSTYAPEPAQQDNVTNGSSATAQAATLQYNPSKPAIFMPSKPNVQQPQTPTNNPSQQQAPVPATNQVQPPNTTTNQSLSRENTLDFKPKPAAFFPSNNQNTSDNTGKQAQQQQPPQGMSIDHAKPFVPKQSAQNPQTSNMQPDNGQAQNESSSQGSQGMKFTQQANTYQAKPYYSGQQYQNNKYQNNNSGGQMSYPPQSNHSNQNAQNNYNNKYQNRQKPAYGYGSYENNQYQSNGNQMSNNYSNNSAQPHGMDGSNGSNFNHVNNTQNSHQPNQQNNQYNQQPYQRSNTMPNQYGGNASQVHPGWAQFQSNSFQPPYASNVNQFDNNQSMNNGQGNFNNQQQRFSQSSQGQPQQQFSTTAPSFQPSPQGNASQPVAQPAAPADGPGQALKLGAQSFRPKEN